MEDAVAKAKFLKGLTYESNVVDVLKDILPLKLKGYRTYNILTRVNVNNCEEKISAKTMTDFYKRIYDLWYDRIMQMDENRYESSVKDAIKRIKNSSVLRKENMNEAKCQKFIFEDYDKEFKGTGLRPSWAQSGEDPVFDGGVFGDFIHFTPFGRKGKETCRLYINLRPNNAVKVAAILAEKCLKNKIRVYGKFWTQSDDRNDTFLVYSTSNNVGKMVELLEEIRRENPMLFVGAEKMNPLLARVNSFIGYGDEPEYKHSSFNLERGEAIDEFFRDIIAREYKVIGDFQGVIRNSLGQELNLRDYLCYRLKEDFLATLRQNQHDIHSGNFPEDITEKNRESYIEIQTKIYEACRKTLPENVQKQINANVDKIMADLRNGKSPYVKPIEFATKRKELFTAWNQDYLDDIIKSQGHLSYSVKIESNLRDKLFDVFDSVQKIEAAITEENVKPYFDKHHVSIRRPYMNIESEAILTKA